MKCQSVGIVGATGAVGEELVKVLGDKKDLLKIQHIHLYASERSAGKHVLSKAFGNLTIEVFQLDKMKRHDVVFMAVSGSFAKEYAKKIADLGPVVIDNSSAFRNDVDIPLVIPEINGHTAVGQKLIANPNCTTAIAAMALWPLHQKFGIKKLIISTYQAASGAGAEGMSELKDQAKAFVHHKAMETKVFQYPLMFNVIPHIDSFQENDYTREEMKVVWETRKIFGCPSLDVSCTAVRIPTLRAHAEAITIETCSSISPQESRKILSTAPGVKVVDSPEEKQYPMPLNATEQYDVEVGRIRPSLVFGSNGLDMFVCGDQVLRGAALNAVLIAEYLVKGDFTPAKTYSPSVLDRVLDIKVGVATLAATVGVAAVATSFLMSSSRSSN